MYEVKVTVTCEAKMPKSYEEITRNLLKAEEEANKFYEGRTAQTTTIAKTKWETIKAQLEPIAEAAKALREELRIEIPYINEHGTARIAHISLWDNKYTVSFNIAGMSYNFDKCGGEEFNAIISSWGNGTEKFEKALNNKINERYDEAKKLVNRAETAYRNIINN